MEIACIGCRKMLNVPESMGGKRVPCPSCETMNNIPTAEDLDDLALQPIDEDFRAPEPPPPQLEDSGRGKRRGRGRNEPKAGHAEPHQYKASHVGQSDLPMNMMPDMGANKVRLPIPWKPIVWAGTAATLCAIVWFGMKFSQKQGWMDENSESSAFDLDDEDLGKTRNKTRTKTKPSTKPGRKTTPVVATNGGTPVAKPTGGTNNPRVVPTRPGDKTAKQLVDEGIKSLASLKTRSVAISKLSKAPALAVPRLKKEFPRAKPDLREGIAQALGVIKTDEARELLADMLSDHDEKVKIAVIHALTRQGGLGYRTMIQALNHKNKSVRLNALHALTEIKQMSALTTVQAMLSDPDAEIRAHAVAALGGGLADPRNLKSLYGALSDEMLDVRFAAARALAHYKIRPKLIAQAQMGTLMNSMKFKQLYLLSGSLLGGSNRAEKGGVKYKVISKLRSMRSIPNATVFDKHANNIIQFRTPSRIESIKKMASKGKPHKSVVLFLILALANTDAQVRIAAMNALRGVKDKELVFPMIDRLGDTHFSVTLGAAEALAAMSDDANALLRQASDGVNEQRSLLAMAILAQSDDAYAERILKRLSKRAPDLPRNKGTARGVAAMTLVKGNAEGAADVLDGLMRSGQKLHETEKLGYALALVQLGKPEYEELVVKALSSMNKSVLIIAARTAVTLKSRVIREKLISVIEKGPTDVGEEILTSIGTAGKLDITLLKRLGNLVGKRPKSFNTLILQLLRNGWPSSSPIFAKLMKTRLAGGMHQQVIDSLGIIALKKDEKATKTLIRMLPPYGKDIKHTQLAHIALRAATGLNYGPKAREWEIHFDNSIVYRVLKANFNTYARDGFAIDHPKNWSGGNGSYRSAAGEPGLAAYSFRTQKQEGESRTTDFKYKSPLDYWNKTFEATLLSVAGERKGQYRAGLEPLTKPTTLKGMAGKTGQAKLYHVRYYDKASKMNRILVGGMMIAQRRVMQPASGGRKPRMVVIRTHTTFYMTMSCNAGFYNYYEPLFKHVLNSLHLTQ